MRHFILCHFVSVRFVGIVWSFFPWTESNAYQSIFGQFYAHFVFSFSSLQLTANWLPLEFEAHRKVAKHFKWFSIQMKLEIKIKMKIRNECPFMRNCMNWRKNVNEIDTFSFISSWSYDPLCERAMLVHCRNEQLRMKKKNIYMKLELIHKLWLSSAFFPCSVANCQLERWTNYLIWMTLFSHLQIWLEHRIESQLIKNISTENRFECFLLQWSKCGMKFMDFLDLFQWFSSLIGISLKPVVNQFAKVAAI